MSTKRPQARVLTRTVVSKKLPLNQSVLNYTIIDLKTKRETTIVPAQVSTILLSYEFENAVYRKGVLCQKHGKAEIQTAEGSNSVEVFLQGLDICKTLIKTESKRRFCFNQVHYFLYEDTSPRLLGVSGFQGTGKTY